MIARIFSSVSLLLFSVTFATEPVELDGTDGLVYIDMAEDLLAAGNSERAVEIARKCYVLAAVIDPQLERSAMLGLIEIEDNQHRLEQLVSSLPSGKLLLGEVVVHLDVLRPTATPKAIIDACKEVQNLRLLDKIQILERDEKRTELLRFASLSLPPALRQVLLDGGKVPRTQMVSSQSLKAELQLLGGTTQWSAAVLVKGNVPLDVTGTIDLAALLGVDTSTYMYKNGRWIAP